MTTTTGVHRHRGIHFTPSSEEIRGILGYGREEMPPRTSEVLEEIENEARHLTAPACAYRFFEDGELSHSRFLAGVPAAGVCLVTIGPALEALVADWRSRRGHVTKALLLDAWGSAAVEATADAAEHLMRVDIAALGLRASRRFSPGYGGWSVSEQRWILPAVESEALGVTATRGLMMQPRKSTTFAVTLGRRPVELRCDGRCDECAIPGCHHRRPLPGTEARS